jgi:hypothetical protein|tara:strand:+ start:156 stop:842 length:687 start_codon:yes stop_codon:yes gene_type:complete
MGISGATIVSQPVVVDADLEIVADADTSKKLAFEVSGITADTTRTVTAPDASGTMHHSGATNLTAVKTGTAGTGVTAVHYGDGVNNKVALTLTNLVITVGNSASLGVGSLIYTLPAGNISVTRAFCSIEIDDVSKADDTPEFGIGTVIATGAVANLGTPTTFENIMEGAAVADTNGTLYINDVTTLFNVLTGAAHTIHANWADAWGANADAVANVNGVIVLEYRYNEA